MEQEKKVLIFWRPTQFRNGYFSKLCQIWNWRKENPDASVRREEENPRWRIQWAIWSPGWNDSSTTFRHQERPCRCFSLKAVIPTTVHINYLHIGVISCQYLFVKILWFWTAWGGINCAGKRGQCEQLEVGWIVKGNGDSVK